MGGSPMMSHPLPFLKGPLFILYGRSRLALPRLALKLNGCWAGLWRPWRGCRGGRGGENGGREGGRGEAWEAAASWSRRRWTQPQRRGLCGMLWAFLWASRGGGSRLGREWADLALTRPGAGPRRAPGTPGAAHWDPGPHRLLTGKSRSLFVTSWPQQRPCFRREGRWAPERGPELGVGLAVAVPEPLPPHRRRASHKTHTRARSARAVTAGTGRRPSFRWCRPLSYT